MTLHQFMTDPVRAAYLEASLWSSSLDDTPLDQWENPDGVDAYSCLASITLSRMAGDVDSFVTAAGALLDGLASGDIGYDFWLTRNGHGAGFWDRDLGAVGVLLSEISKRFASVDFYMGDDGLLYLEG